MSADQATTTSAVTHIGAFGSDAPYNISSAVTTVSGIGGGQVPAHLIAYTTNATGGTANHVKLAFDNGGSTFTSLDTNAWPAPIGWSGTFINYPGYAHVFSSKTGQFVAILGVGGNGSSTGLAMGIAMAVSNDAGQTWTRPRTVWENGWCNHCANSIRFDVAEALPDAHSKVPGFKEWYVSWVGDTGSGTGWYIQRWALDATKSDVAYVDSLPAVSFDGTWGGVPTYFQMAVGSCASGIAPCGKPGERAILGVMANHVPTGVCGPPTHTQFGLFQWTESSPTMSHVPGGIVLDDSSRPDCLPTGQVVWPNVGATADPINSTFIFGIPQYYTGSGGGAFGFRIKTMQLGPFPSTGILNQQYLDDGLPNGQIPTEFDDLQPQFLWTHDPVSGTSSFGATFLTNADWAASGGGTTLGAPRVISQPMAVMLPALGTAKGKTLWPSFLADGTVPNFVHSDEYFGLDAISCGSYETVWADPHGPFSRENFTN